jgi:transposase
MANKRLSKEKQALVLAVLAEGNAINAVCRMFKVGNHSVLRVIRETGEVLLDYQDRAFRNLDLRQVQMDECWQNF